MQQTFPGQPIVGILLILFLAWLSSNNRREINVKVALIAVVLQLGLAIAFLKMPLLKDALVLINQAVLMIERSTTAGTSLVFGYLGGGATPFEQIDPGNGFILAFRALPIVIVFSALSALLWHWRIIPIVIGAFSVLLRRTMGLGGAVGLGSASSIFVGMVEAPLIIRPYIAGMNQGELFVLMTCGMATVAGTVMGLYGAILAPVIPEVISHIVVASLISVPAAIALALIIRPEGSGQNEPSNDLPSQGTEPAKYSSAMDAVTKGTQDGLQLFLNIIAMLIVFVALVNIANELLAWLPFGMSQQDGEQALTLQGILGFLLQPLMWSIGLPWSEVQVAGQLMASKIILNELVAYLELAQLSTAEISDKSRLIMTYALCGFANFGSLGIMLGGLTTLCPERSQDIIKLAPLSIWSGVLATCMTAAVIALVL